MTNPYPPIAGSPYGAYGPVTDDDIVAGCVKYLQTFPDLIALLGHFPDGKPYLFQHTLLDNIEGTQAVAAVIANAGGWGGANLHNTMQFPRLSLELTVDPLRNSAGGVRNPGETVRRATAVWRVFDSYLHRPQGGEQWWGSLRTIACTRGADPALYPIGDGQGMVRLQVFYQVTQA